MHVKLFHSSPIISSALKTPVLVPRVVWYFCCDRVCWVKIMGFVILWVLVPFVHFYKLFSPTNMLNKLSDKTHFWIQRHGGNPTYAWMVKKSATCLQNVQHQKLKYIFTLFLNQWGFCCISAAAQWGERIRCHTNKASSLNCFCNRLLWPMSI